ncbi:MAG TPA: Yip1 family protein [Caulobacteraceae bacterium]|nr:Yip1 family protein [Caulobacteraceae bacterium]
MSVVGGSANTGLVARVQNILMKPAAEWDVIDGEPATVGSLFTGYACILAAIPAVATLIQYTLFLHNPIVGVVAAVLGYVVSLVAVFIMALIIDALAPSFGAQKNQVQALKLTVYSYTASWVAGILNIVPVLGILAALAGLYGLYIMYLGLPKLMKSPPDKTVGYFVVSIVVAIVVNVVISMIVAAVIGAMLFSAAATGAAAFGAH